MQFQMTLGLIWGIWFWSLFLTKTRLHPTLISLNDMSASPKPVSSEDILGQKASSLLFKYISFSDIALV